MLPNISIRYPIVYNLIILPFHITIQMCKLYRASEVDPYNNVMGVDRSDIRCIFNVLIVWPRGGLNGSSCGKQCFGQNPKGLMVSPEGCNSSLKLCLELVLVIVL